MWSYFATIFTQKLQVNFTNNDKETASNTFWSIYSTLTDYTKRFPGEFESSPPSSVSTTTSRRPDPHDIFHAENHDGYDFLQTDGRQVSMRAWHCDQCTWFKWICYLPGYRGRLQSSSHIPWWWRTRTKPDRRKPAETWNEQKKNTLPDVHLCTCFVQNRTRCMYL